MKFEFKLQQYQTDAVDNIVNVFRGQEYHDGLKYRFDFGDQQFRIRKFNPESEQYNENDDLAYANHDISIPSEQILQNIKTVQGNSNIKLSTKLEPGLGVCSLDIDMETGTGKTYVYTKTMFELNKHYGWSKFIVVVPSIAIREGVKKSFEITQDHFMELYQKKARFFAYSSKDLQKIDDFSQDSGINVMIINSQAFAREFNKEKSELNKNAKRKSNDLVIFDQRDEFGSRRPIDVIAANHPIIILDEPQKLGKMMSVTQKNLRTHFNALFSLNFSATHRTEHNKVYALDALDAYNQKLVKKIRVNGIEVKNLSASSSYIFLEEIMLSPNRPPRAKVEIQVMHKSGTRNEIRILDKGDNLYDASNENPAYINPKSHEKTYIAEIGNEGWIRLNDGTELKVGDINGDRTGSNLRRVQIRETISAHLVKEEKLYQRGIKCLSLFFIDEVAKYRIYNDNGEPLLGEYGQIFEQEYKRLIEERKEFMSPDYRQYIDSINVSETHRGYFSIDKGRMVDSSEDKEKESDFELIMRDKERLLSFEEPTRFIFSHSALKEGWDNPNIFQICALKHSSSSIDKRQEVGRGLRICVDRNGRRMDLSECGDYVHDINTLTVIASEGYDKFVDDLQKEIKADLRERPTKANTSYFKDKIITINGVTKKVDEKTATAIYHYLIKNDYIDDTEQITQKCIDALESGTFYIDSSSPLYEIREGIIDLVSAVAYNKTIDHMIENGGKPRIKENPLNDNFNKKEFQSLWNEINNKYAYIVRFDSEELIGKAINAINQQLHVSQLSYVMKVGEQQSNIEVKDLEAGDAFNSKIRSETHKLESSGTDVGYDLVGEIAKGCTLTRRTVVRILKGIEQKKFDMFRQNPDEFIRKIIVLINEEKATMIVEHIQYNKLDDKYDSSIFTMSKLEAEYETAYLSKKHIQNYVFTDGYSEESVERRFAKALDESEDVVVYAKLPRSFQIPTPVGNYAPDWAIAFREGSVKHIYFIAETKGTMDRMQLKPIERAKSDCATALYNKISTSNVRYHLIDSYNSLMRVMKDMD